ncbi:nitroreductase family protein [Gorillibacterium sp. CAU 1737]|uniref:Acg family FMN-binding oxidoreductase n=1 Tax=Gorillibacterium sp. CAU 1737 TaxID=3140362 RepID=UPI003260875A
MKPSARKRKWRMMGITGLVLILMGVCLLLGASGFGSSAAYLEPWNKKYATRFEDPRLQLVAHGILAASSHNMQPWRVKLDPRDASVFYLYADETRTTPEVDPYARQLLVSQGVFLEYVRVAGDSLGLRVSLSLFPDGDYDETKLASSMKDKPVARIEIRKGQPADNPLYSSLFLPDTNRAPYQPTAITDNQVQALEEAGEGEGISVHIYQDEEALQNLGRYALEGVQVETGVERINQEASRLFRANERQKNKERYGFSFEGQGTSGVTKHMLQGLVTLFPSMNNEKVSAKLTMKSTKKAVAATTAYVMIRSASNSRVEQVEAGMSYARVLLTAHSMGLVMQPVSQVLEEYPEMAELHQAVHQDYTNGQGETLQLFVRLGLPTTPAFRTMRRDAMDLLIQ